MNELKLCSFCGGEARPVWIQTFTNEKMTGCSNKNCFMYFQEKPVSIWQSRPLEDALNARIVKLEGALANIANCPIKGRLLSEIMRKIAEEALK